jgi:type III secretory pathway lipoprotein EscJ
MKVFYTGPMVNAELLVAMLEKHGIAAQQEWVDADAADDGDLSRPARILVPDADFDRAWQLFYAEREDEL